MRAVNNALVLALLIGFSAAWGHAQGKSAFPSDADISLAVLQADSAMDQYRGAVGQEETVIGQAGADAVSRDKQLLGSWDFTSKGFKVNPQTFNSELGLEVVLMLDDAARNAALCSATAHKGAATAGRDDLARRCMEASTHLHDASQSVAVLYRRYVEAEHQAVEQAGKCVAK